MPNEIGKLMHSEVAVSYLALTMLFGLFNRYVSNKFDR